MIYHDQLNTIRKNKRFSGYLYPYYEKYSIAELGPSLSKVFGQSPTRATFPFPELYQNQENKNQKVIMLLIDGFSYFHFIRFYKRFPFLEKLAKKGAVYPITSVFPSTTPAALTTIHTGLTPQEHGLPEWSVYFEEFDQIIETLPFKTPEMRDPDGLLQQGGNPSMLFSGKTIYEQLEEQGVQPYMFIYQDYANSTYSHAVHRGAKVVPFADGFDMINKFLEIFHNDEGPSYYFFYWGHIDSIAHHFGTESIEFTDAISAMCNLMQTNFLEKIDPEKAKNTLFLATADHGQINIKGDYIINLNKYPEIEESFMKNKKGDPILPTGSPRDVFLFIDPSKLTKITKLLREELIGQADVLPIEAALQLGLFGTNEVTKKFLNRIGNLVILPYPHYFVWYEFIPGSQYHMLGIHGGLSEEEMIVPFAIAPLEKLL